MQFLYDVSKLEERLFVFTDLEVDAYQEDAAFTAWAAIQDSPNVIARIAQIRGVHPGAPRW